MKNWKQIALSTGVVTAAVVVVSLQLRDGEAAQVDPEAGGHDHAAMGASGEQNPVTLRPEDARRIGVTFANVEYRVLDRTVEALGTVAYDETRLTTVNPKIEGWVEDLYVDFTGAPVRAGQPLMSVYSPKLVSAQEELVLAARLLQDAREGRAADNARGLVESARRRLAYWDVPADEIRRIEETGEVTKTLTLRSPASGLVVEKNVVEGDRIMPGMNVYRIADLSRVWVEADVFEKDLGLVRVGQTAGVSFETYPGERFGARITYVYPTVSMESRTGRIRLELPNPGLRLKPGMYAQITLQTPAADPTLVVPRSAVLSTGPRSLVFVQAADGSLVPREVEPGRTFGRDVEVLEGLSVGERVVSSAAFLVDAESNLGALTAGMGEAAGAAPEAEDHSAHDMSDMADTVPVPMAPMDPAMADTVPAPTGHEGHVMPDTVPEASGHDGHASPTS